jgi:hypothetical protein
VKGEEELEKTDGSRHDVLMQNSTTEPMDPSMLRAEEGNSVKG